MTSVKRTATDAARELNASDPARVFDGEDVFFDRHYFARPGDIIRGLSGAPHMVSAVEEYAHPWDDIPNPARIIRCEDGYGITAFGPVAA